MPRNYKCKLLQRQILGTNDTVFFSSLPVWLLRCIFRRQALSYCLLQPGKEQEKSSCSLKWARLWENRALTVMKVFSQPKQRKHKPAHWCRKITEDSYTTNLLGNYWYWSRQGNDSEAPLQLLPLTSGFVIAKTGVATGSQQTHTNHLFWCDLRDEGPDQGKVLQSQPSAPVLWHRWCIYFVNSNVNAASMRLKKIQWEKLDAKEQHFCLLSLERPQTIIPETF